MFRAILETATIRRQVLSNRTLSFPIEWPDCWLVRLWRIRCSMLHCIAITTNHHQPPSFRSSQRNRDCQSSISACGRVKLGCITCRSSARCHKSRIGQFKHVYVSPGYAQLYGGKRGASAGWGLCLRDAAQAFNWGQRTLPFGFFFRSLDNHQSLARSHSISELPVGQLGGRCDYVPDLRWASSKLQIVYP